MPLHRTVIISEFPDIDQEFDNVFRNADFSFVREDINMSDQKALKFYGNNTSDGQLGTKGISIRHNNTNLLFETIGSGSAIEYKDGISVFYYDSANSKYFKTNHDGTDGQMYVDQGDLVLNPATGYVQIKAEKTTTGDPTGYEGRMYWNTVDNAFKIYADGGWRTIVTW